MLAKVVKIVAAPAQKEWAVSKQVVSCYAPVETCLLDENNIEQESQCLKEVLLTTESPEQFCNVFELVDRNRTTSNRKRILKESGHFRLRPFRVLNKN